MPRNTTTTHIASSGQRSEELCPDRAFVVQLAVADDSDACEGRITHLDSGVAARFRSSRDLVDFMRRILEQHGR